jgi:hypothetical protein
MRNIFIAIGGSGTKVAEALVRLLAAGFPTRRDENGLLTSAGDSLSIWRLDPDGSSGAAGALESAVTRYTELQAILSGGGAPAAHTPSAWSMDVDPDVHHLDPLQLPGQSLSAKTLEGVLRSHGLGGGDVSPLLNVFFDPEDLKVTIDRGFYQKPFIGATVMGIYTRSLLSANAPGSRQTRLSGLQNHQVRFFLCGSLHGGTGASGIPVMANFLRDYGQARQDATSGWRVAACLLGPYSKPPPPPFERLKPGDPEPQSLDSYVEKINKEPWSAGMQPEEKAELARQILYGFYANPDEMELRTRHGLEYFKSHVSADLDEIYLVGKQEPDTMPIWSNGGKSQNNPLNSAEVAAAIAALNFFSSARTADHGQYLIAGATPGAVAQQLTLKDLPRYEVDLSNGREASRREQIDPERVVLATTLAHHLITHQIPWGMPAKGWAGFQAWKRQYAGDLARQEADAGRFRAALAIVADFVRGSFEPTRALGWAPSDCLEYNRILGADPGSVDFVSTKLRNRGIFSNQAKEPVVLGSSAIRISTQEFSALELPSAAVGAGAHLRFVWSTLYDRQP